MKQGRILVCLFDNQCLQIFKFNQVDDSENLFDLSQIECKILSGYHSGIPESATISLLKYDKQDCKYQYILLNSHYGKSVLVDRK